MKKAIGMALLCVLSRTVFRTTAAPSFDAASIKPSSSNDDSSSWHSRLGYLVMKNQTLNACIRIAYGLKADQVTGGRSGSILTASTSRRERRLRQGTQSF